MARYAALVKIGEIAQRAGVSPKTVRYYEQIGVLPEPSRSPNGYRDYDEPSISRLLFIRDAQATGLTLAEITSILDLRDEGQSTCRHVIALLERHLSDLDQHIATLRTTRDQLAKMTARAKSLDPTECTDPNRCQTIDAAAHLEAPPPHQHVHSGPHRHQHS